ncbi:MAG: hypothetical protein HY974_00210, partial [Candidatus Kerfeldbacteria bacterium]|nr:hypothetical protein [Candidatus Kerfeldbacteria bacterium]
MPHVIQSHRTPIDRDRRVTNLPRRAQKLFGTKAPAMAVRTLLVGVDTSEEALRPFSTLTPTTDELQERLDFLLREWTNATQWVLEQIRHDLFENKREILLAAAGKPDYVDATRARELGYLQPYIRDGKSVELKLGSGTSIFTRRVLWYGKPTKDTVAMPQEDSKVKFCVELTKDNFIEVEVIDKESGTFGIKKFDSQRFGGMLSAAYFSERLQERPYVYGPLIEEFIRQQ